MRASSCRSAGRAAWVIAAVAGCAAPAAWGQYSLARVGRIGAISGGAEISAFDAANSRVYTTHATGLDYYAFAGGVLAAGGTIDMAGLLPGVSSVSSVAIDPSGRGFGIASVIPDPSDGRPGLLAIFDTATNTVINTLDAGFHPDMVTFSPDGRRAIIANEGEPADTDREGGVTIVDLSGVMNAGGAGLLTAANVQTVGFGAAHLGAGVSLDKVRINPANIANPEIDPEPEYITADNQGAWVSLQEGNALARFDFASGLWTAINPLGTIDQRIDASDKDGGAFIDDVIAGLPMPDAIASYSAGGVRYILSANEGDARDADEERFADANLDPAALAALDALYGGDARADAALGRLNLSIIDGDTDGDGDIDVPTMFGTRSFTIWAEDGSMVFDSGSIFEETVLAEFPTLFNSDGTESTIDTRSDNKGPEPEGVAVGEIGDRVFAFVGLERVGGVMMFDITDPTAVFFVDYLNTGLLADGGLSPEGLQFFTVGGEHFLSVTYEVSATVEIFQIVPAPASAGALALRLLALRRRRR